MKLATGLTLIGVAFGMPSFAGGPCPPVDGLSAQLVPGRVLLLGELHGTDQSPSFAHAVACTAAESGLETVIALELSAGAQAIVDRYLDSDGAPGARAALLGHSMWTRAYQDGRNSKAMVHLIEGARLMRQRTGRASVLMFDAPTSRGGQDRERRMAARLVESIEARPESVHVILTGNIHSRISPGTRQSADYEPMGYLVKQQVEAERVLSLDVGHEGGSAWLCTPECGVVQLGGRHVGERLSIEIDNATRPSGHDGWYYVGTLTASVPAVGDHEEPMESVVPVEPAKEEKAVVERTTEPADSAAVEKLQGKWQAYQNGNKSWTVEFEDLAFFAEVGPDDWYRGKIFLRSDRKPAEIDFFIEDCLCGYKGESSDAIFRWDGETITMGTPMPNTPRPTVFNEQKGEVVNLVRIGK